MIKRIIKMRSGFTLAEVLITLGIIGVVAAITIPTLMNNVQDMQLKSAWKKEYSVINQAVTQMANDNGGSLKGFWTTDSSTTENSILDMFSDYLKLTKKCYSLSVVSTPEQADKCWHSTSGSLAAHYMKGTILNGYGNNYGYASGGILNDGTLLIFYGFEGVVGDGTCPGPLCVTSIYVDVNGYKKPNVVGKDIFRIYVLENSTKPYGAAGDTTFPPSTDCDAAGFGFGCSTLYLNQ